MPPCGCWELTQLFYNTCKCSLPYSLFSSHIKWKLFTTKSIQYISKKWNRKSSGERKLHLKLKCFVNVSHCFIVTDLSDCVWTTLIICKTLQFPLWHRQYLDLKSHLAFVLWVEIMLFITESYKIQNNVSNWWDISYI